VKLGRVRDPGWQTWWKAPDGAAHVGNKDKGSGCAMTNKRTLTANLARLASGWQDAARMGNWSGSSVNKWILLGTIAVLALTPRTYGLAGEAPPQNGTWTTSLGENSTDYRLGPRDKVKVMVYEWRPSKDEIYGWTALNAEYTVGASGRVALPIIGEVQAQGRTTTDLARMIGERLYKGMGLAAPPDTSVEVTEYRPFYVVGDVEKAGEYPFRPGMTVLKALGLGGGFYRGQGTAGMRIERDLVTSRGDIERLVHEKTALLVRRARLEAEHIAADEMACPPELVRQATGACMTPLLAQERRIFDARRTAFKAQLKTLTDLKSFLEREAKGVEKQVATHARQAGLVKEELDGVQQLARKGLATANRRLGLERNLAQLDETALQLDRDLMRVRQEISKTEISIYDLQNRRSGEIATEIQDVEIKLGQNGVSMQTSERLLFEAVSTAPAYLRGRLGDREVKPTFKIVRMDGPIGIEIPATELTMLQPGDTLKVEMNGTTKGVEQASAASGVSLTQFEDKSSAATATSGKSRPD